ncbi:MAG: outer membrane protein [Parasphingorhabdus sp.]|jgi:outer membrane protein
MHELVTYGMRLKWIVVCLAFSLSLATAHRVNAGSFKIGFVSSGAVEASRMQDLIVTELTQLMDEPAGVEYVTFTALPSPESFQEQLKIASSTPEIRAIIAPGFLASQILYQQSHFSRPTFLTWIVDPNLVGGEVKTKTPNLRWLSTRNDVDNTFKTIAQVIGRKPVTLIVDAAVANLGDAFFEGLTRSAAKNGLQFSVTFLDRSKPVIDQVPSPIAMALVPPMREGTDTIIKQIQAGNIPVFTFEGPKAVAKGAMMTDIVDANESLIARSIALDIFGLLQGEKLEHGPHWLESEHHLTLNLASAQRMGVDLPVEVLASATVVGFSNLEIDSITLEKALGWVLNKNTGLAQSLNNIKLADESIAQAKSSLLSQFDAAFNHTRNSTAGNTVTTGNPHQNTRASINYTQTLYSIVSHTNYEVAKLNKASQLHQDVARKQGAVVNTMNVFLQVLISEASLSAQQESVRLARSNLSMAQKRATLGSGTVGDVYNSEASIATANSNLLAARIGTLEARRALMDLSNTVFDENSVFEAIGLDHPAVAISHLLVLPLLETLSGIQKLSDWSSNQAVKHSPELQASRVVIDSNRLQLDAADKGRYTPEVKLTGQAYTFLDSSTGSSGANLNGVDDISLSVNVSLPLWTSGRLTSVIRETNNQLINSELEYMASKNTAQVAARNSVFSLAQAWQDIKLGKIALSSAEKSLAINQRAYASGAVTIEALQNIQNTYISALSGDKANLYQYIQGLANWQLQVAAVSYLMESDTYQQWSADFQSQNIPQ